MYTMLPVVGNEVPALYGTRIHSPHGVPPEDQKQHLLILLRLAVLEPMLRLTGSYICDKLLLIYTLPVATLLRSTSTYQQLSVSRCTW